MSRLVGCYCIMILFCKNKLTKDFMDCKNTKYSSELVNAHEIGDFSYKKKTDSQEMKYLQY